MPKGRFHRQSGWARWFSNGSDSKSAYVSLRAQCSKNFNRTHHVCQWLTPARPGLYFAILPVWRSAPEIDIR